MLPTHRPADSSWRNAPEGVSRTSWRHSPTFFLKYILLVCTGDEIAASGCR
jgi:hypothetical protein